MLPCSQVRKNTLRKAADLVARCGTRPHGRIQRLDGTDRHLRWDPNAKGNVPFDDDDDGGDGGPPPGAAGQQQQPPQQQQPQPRNGQAAQPDREAQVNQMRQDVQQAEQQQVDDAQQADAQWIASAQATAANVGDTDCVDKVGKSAESLINEITNYYPWMEYIPDTKTLQCRLCALGPRTGAFQFRVDKAGCLGQLALKKDNKGNRAPGVYYSNLNRHVNSRTHRTNMEKPDLMAQAGLTREQASKMKPSRTRRQRGVYN